MNNIKNKTKIILFAVILVAMILPFSSIEMIDAVSEKANKKEQKDKKEKKDKKEQKDRIRGNGYVKKDHPKNYDAEKIREELVHQMKISMDESKPYTDNQRKIIKNLQKQLEKSKDDHREKIIDKELRKQLKKANKRISTSDIPYKMLATGIDYLYINLSDDSTLDEREKYEAQIDELLQGLPYLIEYDEGPKRLAHLCLTTSASDCPIEIGGLQIQIERNFLNIPGSCSLSIPVQKDGVDGFLTAAHCFNGYSEDVYQPEIKDPKLGHSDPTWRSFEDDGECDCAWIKDTSDKEHRVGLWFEPGYYVPLEGAHMPKVGDEAMLRGIHNADYKQSSKIDHNDVEIDDGWFGVRTINLMSFESPVQAGDSGGAVYDLYRYFGIAVASKQIDNKLHVVFVPWDHITENISGLTFIPHAYFPH